MWLKWQGRRHWSSKSLASPFTVFYWCLYRWPSWYDVAGVKPFNPKWCKLFQGWTELYRIILISTAVILSSDCIIAAAVNDYKACWWGDFTNKKYLNKIKGSILMFLLMFFFPTNNNIPSYIHVLQLTSLTINISYRSNCDLNFWRNSCRATVLAFIVKKKNTF